MIKFVFCTLITLLFVFNGFGQTAKEWVSKGELKGKAGDHEAAISCFDKALTLNPKFAEAYYDRGWAWHTLQEYDKAIEDFTKAIELAANNVTAYIARGRAKWSAYKTKELIKRFH
jgi:tetratricopeptide (TPR) repeat protein